MRYICLLSLPLLAATSLRAAEPGDSLSLPPEQLAEVNVTAIKQAPTLHRQAVTVTTIDRAEIDRYSLVGMKGVSEIAPNFYMPDYGSRMTASIYVRGIGARIDQPAVGLNVDNIPYLNKNGYDFELTDIERIEVLRGPQSTLYGRNTIAGQINVYTLSPLRWEGVRFSASGGSYAFSRIAAAFYKKLSPTVGTSITGHGSHNNGYRKNLYSTGLSGETEDWQARWKTVWQPSQTFTLENVASVVNSKQHGYPYASEQLGEVCYNDTSFYRRTAFTEGVTAQWVTPHFTLASITGVQWLHDRLQLDQDFLPASYFTLTQLQSDLNLSQDVVIRGSVGNYSWLAGVFAFYRHTRLSAPVTFKWDGIDALILNNVNPQLPPGMELKWDEDEFVLGSDFTTPTRGVAVYHRSSYMAGPWDFAAGLRAEYEHTNMVYRSHVNTSATMWRGDRPMKQQAIDIDDEGRLHKTFRELLPSLSVTFNHNNSAFFASVTKGYKTGGFNTQMFSQILQDKMMSVMGTPPDVDVDKIVSYKPETSWNYEVGGHFSMDHGQAYATFAAFLIDLRDQQVTVFPEGTVTGRMMANAGRTRSAGAELTLRYTPTRQWLFNASYGYTHATFRRFNNGLYDLSGKRVPYAPEHTLFASATWTRPLTKATTLSVTPDVRATGPIYWDERNLYRQPFYAELGLTAGIRYNSVLFEVWFKNLTDTRFNVFRYESIGNVFFQRGAPLRWGLSVRFDLKDFKF